MDGVTKWMVGWLGGRRKNGRRVTGSEEMATLEGLQPTVMNHRLPQALLRIKNLVEN
jgi:hypothetical protein